MKSAVIGLGGHGRRHLEAYQRLGLPADAICDQQESAIEQAKQPQARAFQDWRDLLAPDPPDVLSVVTNGPTHAEIVIAAAQAGVPRILCEKPMATSVRDGERMIQACEASGTRLAISYGRRWSSGYRVVKQRIQAGDIGALRHLWLTCGGGLFAGNGSHILDLMCMLSDARPVSITGHLDSTHTPNPRGAQFSDPGAVCLVHFDNGMRGVVDMGEDLGVPPRIEIVGTIGRMTIDEVSADWRMYTRSAEDRARPVSEYWLNLEETRFDDTDVDPVNILVTGLRELVEDQPLSSSGADGLQTLEMILGTHVSSAQGHACIRLPLDEAYRGFDVPIT